MPVAWVVWRAKPSLTLWCLLALQMAEMLQAAVGLLCRTLGEWSAWAQDQRPWLPGRATTKPCCSLGWGRGWLETYIWGLPSPPQTQIWLTLEDVPLSSVCSQNTTAEGLAPSFLHCPEALMLAASALCEGKSFSLGLSFPGCADGLITHHRWGVAPAR